MHIYMHTHRHNFIYKVAYDLTAINETEERGIVYKSGYINIYVLIQNNSLSDKAKSVSASLMHGMLKSLNRQWLRIYCILNPNG